MSNYSESTVKKIYDFAYSNDQKVLDHFDVDFTFERFQGQERPALELMGTSIDLGELSLAWYTPSAKCYGGTAIDVDEFIEWMEEVA